MGYIYRSRISRTDHPNLEDIFRHWERWWLMPSATRQPPLVLEMYTVERLSEGTQVTAWNAVDGSQ